MKTERQAFCVSALSWRRIAASSRQYLQLLAVLFEVLFPGAADPVLAADATAKVFELCINTVSAALLP
jgi:hypothetical protein